MALIKIENGIQTELQVEQVGLIANDVMVHLVGLNKPAIEAVLSWIQASLDDKYYFNSNLSN